MNLETSLLASWRVVADESLSHAHKPSHGKHNSLAEPSASAGGTLAFKGHPFSRGSPTTSLWYSRSALVVVSWRTFWQQMAAAQLEKRRPKRLRLSVSKQWPGFCFSKVEDQSGKGDLHVPERACGDEKSDGLILFSVPILKMFNIAIFYVVTCASSVGRR